MRSLLNKLSRNYADYRTFGPRFPLRHLKQDRSSVQSVDIPGIGRVQLRAGTTDAEVFRQVFQSRDYDLTQLKRYTDINAQYRALLAAGRKPVIIDAGANIGAASLWFTRAFPEAQIVAVEPEAANAAICRVNIAAHPAITLHEAAIGSHPGRIRLTNPAGQAWSPRSERSSDGGIDVVTIAGLVASVPDGALFIAKIDIEGFESDLFAAETAWIDTAKVMIIEIHDWMMPGRGTSFALQREMGSRRFEFVISGENLVYINIEAGQRPE